MSFFNYAENEPVGHIDLHGLQKYKPKMQRIESPKDLFSSKMINNLWEGTKTATREFFTKPVGKLMNNTGTAIEYSGIFISMAAPPIGGPIALTGKTLSISGQVVIATDEVLTDGEISTESTIDLSFTILMEILPEPFEKGIDELGGGEIATGIFKAHRNSAVKALEESAKMGVKALVSEDENKKDEVIVKKEENGNK